MVASIVSYIDYKTQIIPDKIMLPSIVLMLCVKYLYHLLSWGDAIAVVIVSLVFTVPILLNMAFGGGDIRFGVFAALFVSLEGVGYFILFSALCHIVLLVVLRKKDAGFAPAMSIGALLAYIGLHI